MKTPNRMLILVLTYVMLSAGVAQGQKVFTDGYANNSNWNNPGNWDGGKPVAGDTAQIQDGLTALITVDDQAANIVQLVQTANSGSGTLEIRDGRTLTVNTMGVGNNGNATGTLRQINGNLTSGTTLVGNSGAVTGVYNHTAGSHTTDNLYIGYNTVFSGSSANGTYNVSASSVTLVAGTAILGDGVVAANRSGRLNVDAYGASISFGKFTQNPTGALSFRAGANGFSTIDVTGTENGSVTLGGTLRVDLAGYTGSAPELILISNAGTDAIVGEFDSITLLNNPHRYSLTYTGGDGNDLALSDPLGPPEPFAVGPDKTYKTISAALADMRDGDVCVISAGVYRERIDVLQNNVTLRGEGRVVITGLDKAGEMEATVVNGHQGLITTVGGPVYDVFLGEQNLMPARFPNKTSPMTSNEDWANSFIGSNGNVNFSGQAQSQFPELSDGYYVGVHGSINEPQGRLSTWYSISVPITGLTEDGFITLDGDEASSGFMGTFGRGAGLGYIIGARAVLDAPGEWYSDGNEVLLIPPSDGDGEGGYEFRTRLYGAVIEGNGVRLENLRFKAATARVHGDDVTFSKCGFEYISPFRHNPYPGGQSLHSTWGNPDNGTAGVFVDGDGFVAENCRFAKSWWSGMTIRGNNARIENCLFEDMNWMARRSAGLHAWGDNITVRHSTFRNFGASAIEGGNANWVEQYAKNNIWEYNHIEDVTQLVVDQGFFYVNHQDGANPKADSIWRYNVGKGSRGPVKGDWKRTTPGFYVDNSSSGYRIHNNIVIDATEAIRYNDTKVGDNAGKDIWFHNNTFYMCDRIGYAHWNRNGESVPDAELILINNLAIPEGSLDFDEWGEVLGWENNFQSLPVSVLENPDAMDFTPTDEFLKTGGIPVLGEEIPYIGAVDPEKGMWRYGADESRLPRSLADSALVQQLFEEWVGGFGLEGDDALPGADPDGDGRSNFEEFLFGTDPTDPTSRFEVGASMNPEGGFEITFGTVEGRIYQVERSFDLSAGSWTPVGTAFEGHGGSESVIDDEIGSPRAFYRVTVGFL